MNVMELRQADEAKQHEAKLDRDIKRAARELLLDLMERQATGRRLTQTERNYINAHIDKVAHKVLGGT